MSESKPKRTLPQPPQPNPQYLKRGGKRPRISLTLPILEFCSWRARGASVPDALRYAGFPKGKDGYSLERSVVVKTQIAEYIEAYKQDVMERVKQRQERLADFVFNEFEHRVRKAKTHKVRGDDSIAKMLHTGLQAVGAIQPAKIVNQAGALAGATFQPLFPSGKAEEFEQLGRQALDAKVEAEAASLDDDLGR